MNKQTTFTAKMPSSHYRTRNTYWSTQITWHRTRRALFLQVIVTVEYLSIIIRLLTLLLLLLGLW